MSSTNNSLLLLEVGGSLAEEADKAHIGALNDVKRHTKSVEQIEKAIFESITDAEMLEVVAAREPLG